MMQDYRRWDIMDELKKALSGEESKYNKTTLKAIDHLPMTIAEIVGNYSRSEKKKADIQRLADICGCSQAFITEILATELGADALPKSGRPRKKKEEKKENKQSPVQTSKVPAKKSPVKKEKVSWIIMEMIRTKLDLLETEINEKNKELKRLQTDFQDLVDFIETHEEKERG